MTGMLSPKPNPFAKHIPVNLDYNALDHPEQSSNLCCPKHGVQPYRVLGQRQVVKVCFGKILTHKFTNFTEI